MAYYCWWRSWMRTVGIVLLVLACCEVWRNGIVLVVLPLPVVFENRPSRAFPVLLLRYPPPLCPLRTRSPASTPPTVTRHGARKTYQCLLDNPRAGKAVGRLNFHSLQLCRLSTFGCPLAPPFSVALWTLLQYLLYIPMEVPRTMVLPMHARGSRNSFLRATFLAFGNERFESYENYTLFLVFT